MADTITLTRDGNLAHIKMDDGRGNAMSTAMLRSLQRAFEEGAAADAILLTGRQKVFCGGLDLDEVVPMDRPTLLAFLDVFHASMRAVFSVERPLIVAAAGSAIAGGTILLLTGDMRMASRDSGQLGVIETQLGFPFPSSALEIVRAALPRHEAQRALLFGEFLTKEQALTRGLLHELVDPDRLVDRGLELARTAANLPSQGTSVVKRALRAEFVARMDAEKARSHAVWADAWMSAEAQARLKKAREGMKKK